jgi:hypothetical protein
MKTLLEVPPVINETRGPAGAAEAGDGTAVSSTALISTTTAVSTDGAIDRPHALLFRRLIVCLSLRCDESRSSGVGVNHRRKSSSERGRYGYPNVNFT